MRFTVRRINSSIGGDFDIRGLSSRLAEKDYTPIIMEAKKRLADVYSESGLIDNEDMGVERLNKDSLRSVVEQRLIYGRFNRAPISGDIIYKDELEGILYFLISMTEEEAMRVGPDFEIDDTTLNLEVGYIGNEEGVDILDEFKDEVENFCLEEDGDIWSPVTYENEEFENLEENEETTFMPASSITDKDVELSRVLESEDARELSIKIKRGGGLLASDIEEKGESGKDEQEVINTLVDNNLLSTEHVIICKQTSNQVNRVPSRESLDELEEIGLQCSCGRPISEERHEKLYVPTDNLNDMTNQSYWMTARLVRTLRNIDISNDDILLNLIDGSDEVDAFIDLEGELVMIELKDSEFYMGHAYAFGGRIAQYKPSYAMIVSTRGVDGEVKDYFERVEPESDLKYVESLDRLDSSISDIASEIRSNKASGIIDALETTSSVSVPIKKSISKKMGVQSSDQKGARARRYIRSV